MAHFTMNMEGNNQGEAPIPVTEDVQHEADNFTRGSRRWQNVILIFTCAPTAAQELPRMVFFLWSKVGRYVPGPRGPWILSVSV